MFGNLWFLLLGTLLAFNECQSRAVSIIFYSPKLYHKMYRTTEFLFLYQNHSSSLKGDRWIMPTLSKF